MLHQQYPVASQIKYSMDELLRPPETVCVPIGLWKNNVVIFK